MKSILHRLIIKTQQAKVYEAVTTQQGLAGWWTPETLVDETNSTIRFAFGPTYFKLMKIEEYKPATFVKWQCLQGHEEWIGSTVSFELQPHEKGSMLIFCHDGWEEQSEVYAMCCYDWAIFLRSLKFLCERGKGFPYPNQNN